VYEQIEVEKQYQIFSWIYEGIHMWSVYAIKPGFFSSQTQSLWAKD